MVDQKENSGYRNWKIENKMFNRSTANEWFSFFRKVDMIQGNQKWFN